MPTVSALRLTWRAERWIFVSSLHGVEIFGAAGGEIWRVWQLGMSRTNRKVLQRKARRQKSSVCSAQRGGRRFKHAHTHQEVMVRPDSSVFVVMLYQLFLSWSSWSKVSRFSMIHHLIYQLSNVDPPNLYRYVSVRVSVAPQSVFTNQ
ncbi:hypothetical protein ATANTOWER_013666 [Ataeniobius toweri]|uniref:Uncharacterized protein n=1 Tax=Ataeniobius toweri TaxID=208326 RepID=A0ABU7BYF7_9TELE|nr:hypothetical protein [Ataeniobius toweri]